MVIFDYRKYLVENRIIRSQFAQQFHYISRLERIGIEIDDIYLVRAIPAALFRRNIDPQSRLARRYQHRVIIAEAVDRSGSEPRHQANQAILALDSGRPAEFVFAERHSGVGRQEIVSDPGADPRL